MSDGQIQDVTSEPAPVAVCVECKSSEVRPSLAAYPLDYEKLKGGNGSFWRCDNCGTRFLGPPAPERKPRRSIGSRWRGEEDLARTIRIVRFLKKYLFPVIVILSTVTAVIYMLDRRDQPQPQIVLPDQ